ncbi:hypothetical protein OBV_33870 [Oscillibacter valericigenes Sjm18-20]|nr:hypothetical protein OBV_33870 [Oscillibacter valericigenes Sjm18-20]
MKRAALALLLAAAVTVGIQTFFNWQNSCPNYQGENSARMEGVEYVPNFKSGRAFAAGFDWDGETEEISVVIPDTVKFSGSSKSCRVTKLGGFFGRGVPCQFGPMLPIGNNEGQGPLDESTGDPELLENLRRRHPGAPEQDLRVRLYLGRYVSEIPLPAVCLLYQQREGEGILWRIIYQVDCDENNQTFYARDGKLYLRADEVPVTQLFCGED